MLGFVVFVGGVVLSQHLAQTVLSSHSSDNPFWWWWSFLIQWLICFGVMVFVGEAPWRDQVHPAFMLACIVRGFYFIKNIRQL